MSQKALTKLRKRDTTSRVVPHFCGKMAALCGEIGKTQDWLKASIRVEQKSMVKKNKVNVQNSRTISQDTGELCVKEF